MENKLTFTNSPIWPDNAKIRWEMDGKGFVNDSLKFIIHSNRDSSSVFEDVCFVHVLEEFPGIKFKEVEGRWTIDDSPIFCNVTEWYNNGKPLDRNQYHMARQAAMQWAENYKSKSN